MRNIGGQESRDNNRVGSHGETRGVAILLPGCYRNLRAFQEPPNGELRLRLFSWIGKLHRQILSDSGQNRLHFRQFPSLQLVCL